MKKLIVTNTTCHNKSLIKAHKNKEKLRLL